MSATLCTLLIFMAWSLGAFGASWPGMARADKLDEIERKQDMQLRLTLAQEICRIHQLRLESSGPVWVQLNASFERRQEDYAAVNDGARYPVQECGLRAE